MIPARIESNLHLPPAILFPFPNLLLDSGDHVSHARILPERIEKLSVWIHEIEED